MARPIASDQDILRFPLNQLLGSTAHVRLLRVLAWSVREAVSAPDAAEETGLSEAGARRALQRLVKTGFVERVGTGRAQQFRLRQGDGLVRGLTELFSLEDGRYRQLLADLRRALGELPEIRTAWLDRLPTDFGEPLHVSLVADPAALGYLVDQVRARILEVERTYDVTIELHAHTRADLPEVDWDEVVLLAGFAPDPGRRPGPPAPDHQARTEWAGRLSAWIADRLAEDATLAPRALKYVDFLLESDQGTAFHDLREWRDILAHYSPQRLADFLRSDTPRARRLRQSSPFFAVLSPSEQSTLLADLEDDG